MKKILLVTLVAVFTLNSYAINKELSNKLVNQYNQSMKENPSKSITNVLKMAQLNWDKLTPEAQAFFKKASEPPVLQDEQIYQAEYFTIHYSLTDESNKIDATDANNDGEPDYLITMADFLDETWLKYQNAGYTMPPEDGTNGGDEFYDVYLAQINAYGYVAGIEYVFDNPRSTDVTEVDAITSYMVLRNEYSSFPEGFEAAYKSTIVHEFMHSVENAYSYSMGTWIAEAVAVWAEIHFYPELTGFIQYDERFFQPDFPINYNGSDAVGDEIPWYSQWSFFVYLSEIYGNDIIKELFNKVVEFAASDGFEWSDYSDYEYIDELLRTKGSDLEEFFQDYLISMALLSDMESHDPFTFENASQYKELLLAKYGEEYEGPFEADLVYEGSEVSFSSETDGNGELFRMGADYFYIDGTEDFDVIIEPEISDSEIFAMVIGVDDNSVTILDDLASGTSVDYRFSVEGVADKDFVLIVCRQDFDNKEMISEDYTVRLVEPGQGGGSGNTPVIADQTFSIEENSANGTSVGFIEATDPGGEDLFFAIVSGNDYDEFSLVAETGEILVHDETFLDFETTPTFTLGIEVSNASETSEATITINLTDVDEEDNGAPQLVYDQEFYVDENSEDGVYIGTLEATDDIDTELYFYIASGEQAEDFYLNENGELFTNSASIDYETKDTYELEIEVWDLDENYSYGWITIYVNDIDENATAIQSENLERLSVYPNPAHNNVSLKLASLSDSGTISVQNALGQQVYTQKVTQLTTTVKVDSYPKGLYFVKYQSNKGKRTIKLIIE